MYCLVENGVVTDGPRELPVNWSNVSNLPLASEDYLLQLGWFPAVLVEPSIDVDTERYLATWSYQITATQVICTRQIIAKTADELAQDLEALRAQKVLAVATEGLARSQAIEPWIVDFNVIGLLEELWPGLNTADLSAEILQVRDIYLAARQAITWLNNPARTLQELQAATLDDVTWP